MHPIYSAFIKRNLFSIIAMSLLMIIGIAVIAINLPRLLNGNDRAIMYLIPAAVITLSSADILRKRIFSSKKKLKRFLSQITPEQNARLLAEFRYNPNGEVLAGDVLILLNKRLEFIDVETLTLIAKGDAVIAGGLDYTGRYDDWYLTDEDVIQKIRLFFIDSRRSVVCEGGRH